MNTLPDDRDDISELIANAQPIDVGSGPFTGQFESGQRDIDVYEFTLGEGEIINFDHGRDTHVVMEVVDAEGNIIVNHNTVGRGPIADGPIAIGDVPAGTYYLVVDNIELGGSFSEGPYEIWTTNVEDLAGDTRETATLIEPSETPLNVFLDLLDDKDMYELNVVEGETYTFDVNFLSGSGMSIALEDEDGNQLDLMSSDGFSPPRYSGEYTYTAEFDGPVFLTFGTATIPGAQPTIGAFELTVTSTESDDAMTLEGSPEDDIITGGVGDDNINGYAGADTIEGLNGDDMINGGNGADTISGNQGNDTIDGGLGADTIFGGNGADLIWGNHGNDTIDGGRGADTILGGNGADLIWGNHGNDAIYGGRGADTILGGNGADTISGNHGNDTIYGGNGADTINGGNGADFINGNRGADTINGGNGADFLIGGRGKDTIDGGNGHDTLYGGSDVDLLTGGAGNDLLVGGNGADTFIFSQGSGYDKIEDFEIGKDKIDLSDFDFDNFNQLNLVEQNDTVFLFIDENTSIELTDIDDIDDLSADDFIL